MRLHIALIDVRIAIKLHWPLRLLFQLPVLHFIDIVLSLFQMWVIVGLSDLTRLLFGPRTMRIHSKRLLTFAIQHRRGMLARPDLNLAISIELIYLAILIYGADLSRLGLRLYWPRVFICSAVIIHLILWLLLYVHVHIHFVVWAFWDSFEAIDEDLFLVDGFLCFVDLSQSLLVLLFCVQIVCCHISMVDWRCVIDLLDHSHHRALIHQLLIFILF